MQVKREVKNTDGQCGHPAIKIERKGKLAGGTRRAGTISYMVSSVNELVYKYGNSI